MKYYKKAEQLLRFSLSRNPIAHQAATGFLTNMVERMSLCR